MSLLLRPAPDVMEGPSGYCLRVAEANLLPYGYVADDALDVGEVDVDIAPLLQRWRTLKSGPAIWIHRRARWCPVCLAQHGHGRIGWELLFADACAGCGHWLLDACSTCGDPVTWRRDALARCACGANLCDQSSRMAPPAVVKLSRAMEQLALGLPDCELPHVRDLSISQCSRLVRVLGAYGSARHQRSPQKIVGADTLDVSWTISTVAGEILSHWPSGFHAFLARQASPHSNVDGRMKGVFGGFYRALYKGLQDPEFDWVRRAFEDFIAENWTGAIGRRNRRMPETVLARLAWLPATEAACQLGISMRRMKHLVQSGHVEVRRRMSAAGREFLMVRREDVLALSEDVTSDLTLAKAAALLGIKRQRLGRLLAHLCPAALKLTLQGTPWGIPRDWLNDWLNRINALPQVHEVSPEAVSLDSLLRYGPLDDQAVAELLLDIAADKVLPVGRLSQRNGLASLLMNRHHVDRFNRTGGDGLSVPHAAERLGVKQEVAYALIRAGLLAVDQRALGRRTAAVVREDSIDAFNDAYVFAADLARTRRTSSRSLVRALSQDGVDPVAGPSLGNCRQIVYARSDVAAVQWIGFIPSEIGPTASIRAA